jgi:tRNA dimethylallyltransferase
MEQLKKQIVLVAGPTASGKSGAAMALARACNGIIINADAMQVYRDLRVVTARPSPEEEAQIPHRLYGYLDGADLCSAGRWSRDALAEIKTAQAEGKTPILVGGTGLYFKALTEGLSPIPDVPTEIRQQANEHFAKIGSSAFREEILTFDPPMVGLAPNDRQRMIRAWEVYHHTGKPLSWFQGLPRQPLLQPEQLTKLILLPAREKIYENCNMRLGQMVEQGALQEVSELMDRGLAHDLPVMKSLGVRELAAYLRDEIDLTQALEAAQTRTRQFAKRQMTWLRHQCDDWQIFDSPQKLASKAVQIAG